LSEYENLPAQTRNSALVKSLSVVKDAIMQQERARTNLKNFQ